MNSNKNVQTESSEWHLFFRFSKSKDYHENNWKPRWDHENSQNISRDEKFHNYEGKFHTEIAHKYLPWNQYYSFIEKTVAYDQVKRLTLLIVCEKIICDVQKFQVKRLKKKSQTGSGNIDIPHCNNCCHSGDSPCTDHNLEAISLNWWQ